MPTYYDHVPGVPTGQERALEQDIGKAIPLRPGEEVPKALHYSEDKTGVDQIPPELLLEWGRVFTYGAMKYARNNWRKGTEWHEFIGSALRHILRWQDGEDIDPETGLHHLAHALWNVGTLLYYQRHEIGTDDREGTLRKAEGR